MPLTPHIVVRDAARAAAWYAEALGAREQDRLAVPDGRLMSVELRFGDAALMLADEFPELGVVSPLTVGGTSVVLTLDTPDVDAVFARAIAAGATSLQAPGDAFWGERHARLADPFGHHWGLAHRLREVPRDELERAVAAAFGDG
jgi:PhnB protein